MAGLGKCTWKMDQKADMPEDIKEKPVEENDGTYVCFIFSESARGRANPFTFNRACVAKHPGWAESCATCGRQTRFKISGVGVCLALALLLVMRCLPASCCDDAASRRLRAWRVSRWRETMNASLSPGAWTLVTCRDRCASLDGGRTFSCRNHSSTRTKTVNAGLLFVVSGGLCVHPSKGNLTMIITMHNIARIQTLHPSARIVLMMGHSSDHDMSIPQCSVLQRLQEGPWSTIDILFYDKASCGSYEVGGFQAAVLTGIIADQYVFMQSHMWLEKAIPKQLQCDFIPIWHSDSYWFNTLFQSPNDAQRLELEVPCTDVALWQPIGHALRLQILEDALAHGFWGSLEISDVNTHPVPHSTERCRVVYTVNRKPEMSGKDADKAREWLLEHVSELRTEFLSSEWKALLHAYHKNPSQSPGDGRVGYWPLEACGVPNNAFIASATVVEDMYAQGLFSLHVTTKLHTLAVERMLGLFAHQMGCSPCDVSLDGNSRIVFNLDDPEYPLMQNQRAYAPSLPCGTSSGDALVHFGKLLGEGNRSFNVWKPCVPTFVADGV